MRNKARNTRSPEYLDEIPEGCVIDGSHQHPDDFSVAVIRYAEKLGYEIDDADLVHVLIREVPGVRDQLGLEYNENFGHYLSIASDEAVDWLNEHITQDGYAYLIEESDLFLEKLVDEED